MPRQIYRQLLIITVYLFWAVPQALSLSWRNGEEGTTASFSYNPERDPLPFEYRYDIKQAPDQASGAGPLTYISPTIGFYWMYNAFASANVAFGSWYWHMNNTVWKYDPSTQELTNSAGSVVWQQNTYDSWQHKLTRERWIIETTGDPLSHPTINASQYMILPDDTILRHRWTEMGSTYTTWINNTSGMLGLFNPADSTWALYTSVRTPTPAQIWRFNPERETYVCLNADSPPNSWVFLGENKWREEESGEKWLYTQPEGPYHYVWQKNSTGEKFAEATPSGALQPIDSDGPGIYFPPLFPPQGVIQSVALKYTYNTLPDLFLPKRGDFLQEEEESRIHLFSPDLLTGGPLTQSGIHLGLELSLPLRGYERWGWNFDESSTAFFESDNGESWSLTGESVEGIYTGSVYTNTSPGLQFTTTVKNINALDIWWQVEQTSSHRWRYFGVEKEWRKKGTDECYQFDLATLHWHNKEGSDIWEYVHDESDWYWRNISTGQAWHRTMLTSDSVPASLSGADEGYWHNTMLNEYWRPTGTEDNPQWMLYDDSSTWTYDKTMHVWTSPSHPEEQRILFPLLPSTMAGIAGGLNKKLREDTNSHSAQTETSGFWNRITEIHLALAAYKEQWENLRARASGNAFAAEAFPFKSELQKLYASTYGLLGEFEHLYTSLNRSTAVDQSIRPAFQWAPTQQAFPRPGSFGFIFSETNITQYPISFGFSREWPHNELTATPEYVVTLSAGASTLTITVECNNEVVHSSSIPILRASGGPKKALDLRTNVPLWGLYEQGHIRLGIGDIHHMIATHNGVNTILDYTIDAPEAAHMNYFATIVPNTFCHPYDGTHLATLIDTADFINYSQDFIALAPLEEVWKTTKEQFLLLATRDAAISDKDKRSKEIFDVINGTNSLVKPYEMLSAIQTNLYSATSQPHAGNMLASFDYALEVISAYHEYADAVRNLQDCFTSLFAAQEAALTTDEQTKLLQTTERTSNRLIATLQTNLNEQQARVNALLAITGNADLAPFKHFFDEEAAHARNFGSILGMVSTENLFNQITKQYIRSRAPETFSVTEWENFDTEMGTRQETIIRTLATRIMEGSSTLFAALLAAESMLCPFVTFDDLRINATILLSTRSIENLHFFSPTSFLNAYNQLSTLIQALNPLIATTPNTRILAGSPSSTAHPPQPRAKNTYLHQTIQEPDAEKLQLSGQICSINPGKSDFAKKTAIQTGSSEHVRQTVREIRISEDDKTAAFVELYGNEASIHLGSAYLTAESGSALSLFGAAHLTADGNIAYTLNNDIIIHGELFLSPSVGFGLHEPIPGRCLPAISAEEADKGFILFSAPVARSITITSGSTLDFRAFSKRNQRIVFGANIKVIFEPHSRLRLANGNPSDSTTGCSIAFTENSELIFQSSDNLDSGFFATAEEGHDILRTKILGIGSLEFQNNAQALITRQSLVSVEADYLSPRTALTIKLDDNARWEIGNETARGGGFQIGNTLHGGFDDLNPEYYPNSSEHARYGDATNPFIPQATQIDFNLILQGPGAVFSIGRQGFFGLAVGTINKKDRINGSLTSPTTNPHLDEHCFDAWMLQSLYDVGGVGITIAEGQLIHDRVGNGTDRDASLLALGTLMPRASYTITLSTTNDNALSGGGNVALIRENRTPRPVTVWNTIRDIQGSPSDDGATSVLAPAPLFLLRKTQTPGKPGWYSYGRANIRTDGKQHIFNGPLDETYLALTLQRPALNKRYVLCYEYHGQHYALFINRNRMITTMPITARSLRTSGSKQSWRERLVGRTYLRSTQTIPAAGSLIL